MIFPQPAPPRIRWRLPLAVRIGLIVLAVLVALPYVLTPFYLFGEPGSTVMLGRRLVGAKVERHFVPISQISPILIRSVIVAEDGRFCEHHGVDFQEISNALADAEDMDDVRGGSTITQQLAKNLFLWPGRSYVRKVLELPLALWIDLVMPKRRIMELYLNVAEWGPNGEFGVEAGSQHAFRKTARQVGAHEAALLAAALPNPVRRSARTPGPGVRRLANIYVSRAASAGSADRCVRSTP